MRCLNNIHTTMNRIEVDDTILQARSVLERVGTTEDYNTALKKLGALVSATSLDHEFRTSLADDFSFLESVVDVVTNSLTVDLEKSDIATLYVRVLRGMLILLRNLVTSTKAVVDIPMLLLNVQHFITKIGPSNLFFGKCLSTHIEILANLSLSRGNNFHCNLQLVSQTFDPVLTLIMEDESIRQPFLIFLNGIFSHDDNVTSLLKDECNENLLEALILGNSSSLRVGESVDEQVLYILEKIISDKSFKSWIEKKEVTDESTTILKIARLVATTEKEWDNTQCIIIMEWVYSLFEKWADIAIRLLFSKEEGSKLQDIHAKLVIALDIISDLMKYHQAKQFLEFYNALDPLIRLFRAAHENGEIATKKASGAPIQRTGKVHFPMVKSLIVEILAFIVHNSFEAQEKVRELHGLELLLSNCVIDDNNPFIKERAILCLRFVLENNLKNQEFVAQLEAKEVVDDRALKEAGFEVNVEDGRVKLKKC